MRKPFSSPEVHTPQQPANPYEGWSAEMPIAPPEIDGQITHPDIPQDSLFPTSSLLETQTPDTIAPIVAEPQATEPQAEPATEPQPIVAPAAAEVTPAAPKKAKKAAKQAAPAPTAKAKKGKKKNKPEPRDYDNFVYEDEIFGLNGDVEAPVKQADEHVLSEEEFADLFGADAVAKFVETGKEVAPVVKSGKVIAPVAKFKATGRDEQTAEAVADAEEEQSAETSIQMRIAKKLGRAALRTVTRGKYGKEEEVPTPPTPEEEKAARKAAKKAAKQAAAEEAARKEAKRARKAEKAAKKAVSSGHWATFEPRTLIADPTQTGLDSDNDAPDAPIVFDLPDQSVEPEPATAEPLPQRRPMSRFARDYVAAQGGTPTSVQGDLDQAVAEITDPMTYGGLEMPKFLQPTASISEEDVQAEAQQPATPAKVARPVAKVALKGSQRVGAAPDDDQRAGYL